VDDGRVVSLNHGVLALITISTAIFVNYMLALPLFPGSCSPMELVRILYDVAGSV